MAHPGRQALHREGRAVPGLNQPISCPSASDGPRLQALWGCDSRSPCSLAREWPQSSLGAPQGPGQQQAVLCPHGFMVAPLVIRGDIDVFPVGLLRGDTPPVDMVGALLLLLRFRPFFFQLLPFVLCPPVLEPHLYLGQGGRGTDEKHPRGSQVPRGLST